MSHHNIEDSKPLSVSPNFGVLARPRMDGVGSWKGECAGTQNTQREHVGETTHTHLRCPPGHGREQPALLRLLLHREGKSVHRARLA